MMWVLMGIIIVQMYFIIYMELQYQKKESNLLDRIMAKDYTEYKTIAKEIPLKEELKLKEPTKEEWNQLMSDMHDGKVG